MATPQRDGCYVTTLRTGEAFVWQVSGGRLVDLRGPVQTARRPKRRTTRRLGDSWRAVVLANEERRRRAMLEALADGELPAGAAATLQPARRRARG